MAVLCPPNGFSSLLVCGVYVRTAAGRLCSTLMEISWWVKKSIAVLLVFLVFLPIRMFRQKQIHWKWLSHLLLLIPCSPPCTIYVIMSVPCPSTAMSMLETPFAAFTGSINLFVVCYYLAFVVFLAKNSIERRKVLLCCSELLLSRFLLWPKWTLDFSVDHLEQFDFEFAERCLVRLQFPPQPFQLDLFQMESEERKNSCNNFVVLICSAGCWVGESTWISQSSISCCSMAIRTVGVFVVEPD